MAISAMAATSVRSGEGTGVCHRPDHFLKRATARRAKKWSRGRWVGIGIGGVLLLPSLNAPSQAFSCVDLLARHRPRPASRDSRAVVGRSYAAARDQPEELFLRQVEATVASVEAEYGSGVAIPDVPHLDREAVGIARNLDRRLRAMRRSGDCPRCWMQLAHCICDRCPPVPLFGGREGGGGPTVRRIFLIMHHKEIGLKVDTAKLILSAFPDRCRLVVAGIGSRHQDSMRELEEALDGGRSNCLVLFPDKDAPTFAEICREARPSDRSSLKEWDVFVPDGTWSQARKIFERLFSSSGGDGDEEGARRVQLSSSAVDSLDGGSGHQLRRHDVAWRQVGTFEATRLFLQDVAEFRGDEDDIARCRTAKSYQDVANLACLRELGLHRGGKRSS